MMSRKAMETELDRISFSMDELRLFLDTHPYQREALSAFKELRSQREKLLESYERSYGPLCAYQAGGTEKWNWVQNPWPWEGEN